MNRSARYSQEALVRCMFLVALVFVFHVNGALPFFASPTLGQAVWAAGFSQSFLNESLLTIYAHNFGAPEPAAIAFGLAGVWPIAVFMTLGMNAIDAYSAMVVLWLTVAFFSAYKIGRMFDVPRLLAILGALAWGTMPMVWNHSGYSMVSTGIALLPLYFLAAFTLFRIDLMSDATYFQLLFKIFFPYVSVCLLSIFMDGYSFMMFASGASLIGGWVFISESSSRQRILGRLCIHLISFGIAYACYALYIGKAQFHPAPLDFFRGWGVDVTFLLFPSAGVHWLPDFLGWSEPRSGDIFFGDASVWTTSFALPVLVGAIFSAIFVKKHFAKCPLILIFIFGFYMALGPSIKFNSVKPVDYSLGPTMDEEYAIVPTGSELLSKNLPGFRNMRASYRWGGLGAFGAWGLIMLGVSRSQKKNLVIISICFLGVVIVFNLPDLFNKHVRDVRNRSMFLEIDSQLVDVMADDLDSGDRVVFLPWRNDFLVNYIASRLDIISYNIGGDKNLSHARQRWPRTLLRFPMGQVHDNFVEDVLLLLARNEADVVVLPYIDMLWAAHRWPYPVEYREQLSPVASELENSGFVEIEREEYYAVIRLKTEYLPLLKSGRLESIVARSICSEPVCLRQPHFSSSTPRQVGMVSDGNIVSDGDEGFLHFGPYVSFEPGKYHLVLRGEVRVNNAAWVDVVSGKGKVEYAKFHISGRDNGSGIIAEGYVELSTQVQDLEVRVFVGEEDQITLKGYHLIPVDNDENEINKVY
ncbi:hypothetical protein HNO51_11465 [Billgrantia sulfidoxydans]|uniref:Uncharacterized protein n=1 Tax=Billgrantia sulfidoxydans TaxID=2733484 RepID=A0ABX7W4J5_9GAMM|nr:hypothetical protein [Halomonas sulfidoxydans]QTP55249.1 hypothetical protein HNO51_11465 [Halomonas sulfidoxydans]